MTDMIFMVEFIM